MEVVVKTEDLVKYYGTGGNLVKAVNHVDLEIERGKFTVIMGRSGSGKSTLLHLIGGLDKPGSGNVYIENKNIFKYNRDELAKFRRRKIGFIFQDFKLIQDFTVEENVSLPLILTSKKSKEINKRTEEILRLAGLGDRGRNPVDSLSGGQKQRVAIARALINNPKILLAD